MKRKTLVVAVMILAVVLPVLAAAQREYPCYQLANEPVLDGKLDDAVWQNIPEATGFFVLGGIKVVVERPTFFKAGWTTNALYFAIRCIEPVPDKIKANQPDMGDLWLDDDLELFFVPSGSSSYYQLVTNARGARWNGKGGQAETLKDWKAAASIGTNEWRVEVKIPFAVLNKIPGQDERWKFNVARSAAPAAGPETERYTTWSRLMKAFNEAHAFSDIVFKKTEPGAAEIRELEQQMNNPGLMLQKILRGMVAALSVHYKEFDRRFREFDQKGLADQKLKNEAAALKQAMESMEKAATAKEPDMKAVEAALTVNLSDKLKKATSNCCIKVFLGVFDDELFTEDNKYYTSHWKFGGKWKSGGINDMVVFNCTENMFSGKPVTKINYTWKGGKLTDVTSGGEKEVSADEFYIWRTDSKRLLSPRFGLWVYGNGSGDKLMRCLPVDWKGWRYVELSAASDFENYGELRAFPIITRADQTGDREPIYFGPGIFYGEIGQIIPFECPTLPYPFPFYLAQNEMMSIPINGGAYDVEIGLDKRVTDGKIPEIYVNDVLANEKSSAETVKYPCEVKNGFICVRSVCKDRWFSGIRYIRICRQNQTVAYCDATVLKQTKKIVAIGHKGRAGYTYNDPTSSLETNRALFERELGGKQLAAAPRIVYQFKLAPGEYRVRLRFNRWRGTYPETAAKFDVYLQGDKVMEIRKPNRELLVRDFAVKVTNDYMQAALLSAGQDACAWLGDISIYQGEKMIGFIQPRPSIPESISGDYYGLRNLVPNPSFEIEAWQRNWASIPPANNPVRTNSFAHHGDWSMCLERTTGPAGIIYKCKIAEDIIQKIRAGAITNVCKDEKFIGWEGGVPIDYTRPYRFAGWVKAEQATGQTYLQIIWLAGSRFMLDEQPLLPGFPKWRKLKTYFSILGVSESAGISGTRDWQQISVEARPPYGATRATFVLRSDDNQGKVYFDDLDFDGFGSDPVEIILPQVGYHPNGEKLAFVKTGEPVKNGEFQLNDSGGKTVFSGKLKPVGVDSWGVYLSRADFSSCHDEGRYILKVTTEDMPDRTTPSFAISSNLYRDLGMLSVTGYFHIARCGFDAPGWHPACHLDDAAICNGYRCGNQPEYLNTNKPKGEIIRHVDLTGGWHDAGSLDKYGYIMDGVIINLCRFWNDTHYVSDQLKEKYPDVLSEACWGIDYLMRSIDKENNKIYDAPIEWDPITRDYQCLGSDPTDNIINTSDDRVCQMAEDLNEGKNQQTSLIPVALTRFAGLLREYDQAKANSLLEIAGMWTADGNLALAMARYVINGQRKEDLPRLENSASRKIKAVKSSRFPKIIASHKEAGDIHLLFEYFELCPEDRRLKEDFKALVRRICDEIIRPLADNNVYGVADQVGEPVTTRAFSPVLDYDDTAFGVSPLKYLQIAYFLIQAGRLLKDPELISLAERHIQYVLGRNPHGLSMVGGAGYKVYSMATLMYPYGSKWFECKGQIPGSLGSLYGFSDGSRNWIYSYGPLDFPIPQTASELVSDTYLGNGEVWEVPVGWFIAACGALDRALREMGR